MRLLEKDQKFLEEYKANSKPDIVERFFIIFVIFTIMLINSLWEDLLNPLVSILLLVSVIVGITIISSQGMKKFLNRYGLNEEKAEHYYQFLTKDIKYAPLLHRFSKLNPSAKSSQSELLKKWYSLSDDSLSEYIFKGKYNKTEWNISIRQLKSEDTTIKRKIINRLFQLAILEDGIHNDEWNLLMQLAAQLQFKESYINELWFRYDSLRTEFGEYKESEEYSKNEYVDYSLKEYYAVLGLDENATNEEVRRAYHELALQHHPDLPKNAGRIEECEKMMIKINEAYEKVRR